VVKPMPLVSIPRSSRVEAARNCDTPTVAAQFLATNVGGSA
jgi:hypothetical protein